MLQPKYLKYKKRQKGRIKGIATRGILLTKGSDYGLKALEATNISASQIEAIVLTIKRNIKKQGTFKVRIFPDHPITKKPAEVRMGKGKGAPEYYVAKIKPGRMLFELGGVSHDLALESFRLVDAKLQIKTRVVMSKFASF